MRVWRRILRDESGMKPLEYAIIAGLVLAGLALIAAALASWISRSMSNGQ